MKQVLTKVFGDPQKRVLTRLKKTTQKINAKADVYKNMSDAELCEQTELLKNRLSKKGVTLDTLLPDAFALVRETSDRVLGMRHFDVQLIGGMVLHEGNVAELKTGEGKTLMATLPSYLNALAGKGVHVVTVNDYLAQRDTGWMGQLHHFLGLSVGCIINDASFIFDPDYDNEAHDDPRMRKLRPCTRKEAYEADITYGTNNEFGFDYLRDNMANRVDLLRQRGQFFAIVDEVDSILIDEARTPLIISGQGSDSPELYQKFAQVVSHLSGKDYIFDEKRRQVALTDEGVDRIEKALGITNLYSPENVRSVFHIDQALKAQVVFKRDKDYVVTADGEVMIVDEYTGRIMHGRRYSEGLHQALEAKENVPVQQESRTLATVSFQNYFRLYEKLSGMTGTAFTEAEEFAQVYGLDVVQVPPNKPLTRKDLSDKIFKTEAGKIKALVADVKRYHEKGQPVLIGSASIVKNEKISKALTKASIKHELLNAKNNEREAAIIAKAGEKGAVTLATNIAGRGTDIVLASGVKELGGLVVLGSERHEARRIDNQLRGRGGRQGDPGVSQFYVSTEDDLMRIFQGERIASLMDRLGVAEDEAIENRAVSRTLEAAQKRVEGYHYDSRKQTVQYDDVINRHRKVVYRVRREILLGEDIRPEINKLIQTTVAELTALPSKRNEKFVDEFAAIIPAKKADIEAIGAEKNDKRRLMAALKLVQKVYAKQEKSLKSEVMRGVEREVYLSVLDSLWMQHLENMTHLREGIGWRGVGQRDPLVEYRFESQKLYDALQKTLRDEVLRLIFHVTPADISPQAMTDDIYESELTTAAAHSVERGVNEIGESVVVHDDEFKPKKKPVKKSTAKAVTKKKRKAAKVARKRKS